MDKVDVQLLSLAEVFEEAFDKIQASVKARSAARPIPAARVSFRVTFRVRFNPRITVCGRAVAARLCGAEIGVGRSRHLC